MQVGDSTSEQNGQFKENLRVAAHVIRDEQRRTKPDIRLLKTDIVSKIMKAFPKSFGHVRNNKKAIAKRGWNPLNRACLLNNKIMEKKGSHRYASEDDLDTEFVGHIDNPEEPTNLDNATKVSLFNLNRRRKFSKSEWLMTTQKNQCE